jgi:hypothetical protein
MSSVSSLDPSTDLKPFFEYLQWFQMIYTLEYSGDKESLLPPNIAACLKQIKELQDSPSADIWHVIQTIRSACSIPIGPQQIFSISQSASIVELGYLDFMIQFLVRKVPTIYYQFQLLAHPSKPSAPGAPANDGIMQSFIFGDPICMMSNPVVLPESVKQDLLEIARQRDDKKPVKPAPKKV